MLKFVPPVDPTPTESDNFAPAMTAGSDPESNPLWKVAFEAGESSSKAALDIANERVQRWQAEFENLQRRTTREVAEADRKSTRLNSSH